MSTDSADIFPDRLHLIKLVASNIKRVKLVAFSPTSAVVQISGENGSGKSSVVDSVEYALTGKRSIPSQPIRDGAPEGESYVLLDFDAFTVRREFTNDARSEEERENGVSPYPGSAIVMRTKKGATISAAQAMLNKWWSELAADPITFQERMTPREQLAVLRKVVTLDVDLDALDKAIDTDFATRTGVGRERKELEARVDAYLVDPEWPAAPINVSALLAEMTVASEYNRELEKQKAYRQRELDECRHARERIARMVAQADELEEQALKLRAQVADLDARTSEVQASADSLPPLDPPRDLTEMRAAVERANELNDKVRQRQEWEALVLRRDSKREEEKALTEVIDRHRTERDAAIARAKFPVDGLSFGKDEIVFKGKPLSQAAKAEQWRVSLGVVFAQNPRLRLVIVKDGALLDSKSLAIVEEMARERDFLVLMETVDESGEVGIYLEDGSIKRIQPGVADALT